MIKWRPQIKWRPVYCKGCVGCFSPQVNKDGSCPCTNCLVKVTCRNECDIIKWNLNDKKDNQ
jgi:hypothetical protein